MDRIHIRDLCLRCIIGIYPHERREKQDVIFNILLTGDFSRAERSDDIGDAVNYKTITKKIIRYVEESDCFLIERLAGEVAAICLAEKGVLQATVTVDKPGALRFARSVAVEITRERPPARKAPPKRKRPA